MVNLPQYQSDNQSLTLMQNRWAEIIQPVIDKPINAGNILENISLVSGNNTINHKLGRKLKGWFITRMRSSFAQVYDNQDTNQMTDKTLVLNSSGSVVVDLLVF